MEIRQAISMYLTAKAYNEAEFKEKFENPNKNLDECVGFVTAAMYKKAKEAADKGSKFGVVVPSDDEVFALAVQYYMDDDLKVEPWNFFVPTFVSASATTFTDEEKAKMRQDAIKKYQDEVIAEQKKKAREAAEKKAGKGKDTKPAKPVLVPDAPATTTETATATDVENTEEKPAKVVQLSLF